MPIPFFSIVTLFTEVVVTALVIFIVRRGYRTGVFPRRLAFSVLGYEALFNISYMVSRTLHESGEPVRTMKPGELPLAIFHGTFSLVMFVALVAFFLLAARGYGRGENYFLLHRKTMIAFLSAWGISVLSGFLFFARIYLF